MPGVVSVANPTTVLPYALSASYVESRSSRTRVSGPYGDGRDQRASLVNVSRKVWNISRRTTYSEWIAIRDFYLARRGPLEPFYFYPLAAEHDPTGASTTGRYIVRFAGEVTSEYGLGRISSRFDLIEVA